MIYPSKHAQIPEGDLMSWNTDRDVEPVVMTRGIMYKTGGVWYFWDGQSRSDDAGLFRVSALGVAVTTSPLSADGSSVSAIQGDASKLRVSAYADDAAKFRVSAINFVAGVSANQSISALGLEGTAHIGQVSATLVDDATINKFLGRVSALGVSVATSPLSADGSSVSALQGDAAKLRISAFNLDAGVFKVSAESDDAGQFRVSAIGTQTVSAHEVKQSDASSLMVSARLTDDETINKFFGRMSAISEGANLCRVSALGVTFATAQTLSATCKEGTSFIGQVSATLKAGTASIGLVSATLKEGTAFVGQVSAILKDNATTATYLGRTSSIQGDAANQQTSCKSGDAALMRVSADLFCDTTGSMTAFRSLSLSASQAVKATAGAIYGYYLWNTTTVPQYIKFTNTSGAINVGTDVPIFMAMIPASAAANVEFGHGIKGFTAGIGVHATSAVADNATTPAAASAVGGVILYA